MAADRSDDADVPSAGHSDHPADRSDAPADHGQPSRREQIEPRSRDEAWTAALRNDAAVEERTEPGARSNPAGNEQETPADASFEKTADESRVQRRDHSADRTEAPTDNVKQPGRPPIEPPSREERSTDLRFSNELQERTEPVGSSEPGARSKPGEPTENGHQPQPGGTWDEKADLARWMWGEYKRRWPDEERPPVDRSDDPPGTWRDDGDRTLDPQDNERVDKEYDRIVERGEKEITPAMLAVESQDPHRHLIGFENHLKGRDRLKEKVCDTLNEQSELSPEEAISLVHDALRYTFQYEESDYTRGVLEDIARLQEQGLRQNVRKNFWSDDQYKGINSQWIEPVTGQRFEVQFHTHVSYEAKQITHPAYERLRAVPKPDEFEQMVLEAFQKKVTAEVSIPPGAADIPDYPERGTDAR